MQQSSFKGVKREKEEEEEEEEEEEGERERERESLLNDLSNFVGYLWLKLST